MKKVKNKTTDTPLVESLWAVESFCGQYSDKRSWIVCVYRTEEEAKYHAERAQARSEELERKYESYHNVPAEANEWDTQESHDYTGTRYISYMIELRSLTASLE